MGEASHAPRGSFAFLAKELYMNYDDYIINNYIVSSVERIVA